MDTLLRQPRGRLAALALACLITALAVPSVAPGAARVFKKGSHGKRVLVIQRALGLHADGAFGPATVKAVKRFQRRHGLTADGLVGPATWKLIRRVRHRQEAPRRPAAVRQLQRALGIS